MGVVGGGALGVPGGGVLWGWGPTQGGTETRRLQSTERVYEGAYTFGACKRVGGQARSVKDPPTLWSGVLEHFETKGGGFLPPTPLRPGRLAGAHSKLQPVLVKRSKPRPVWAKRGVVQQKTCHGGSPVNFSYILESL